VRKGRFFGVSSAGERLQRWRTNEERVTREVVSLSFSFKVSGRLSMWRVPYEVTIKDLIVWTLSSVFITNLEDAEPVKSRCLMCRQKRTLNQRETRSNAL